MSKYQTIRSMIEKEYGVYGMSNGSYMKSLLYHTSAAYKAFIDLSSEYSLETQVHPSEKSLIRFTNWRKDNPECTDSDILEVLEGMVNNVYQE